MTNSRKNVVNILLTDQFQRRTIMVEGAELHPASYANGFVEIKDKESDILYRFWEAGRGPILKHRPEIDLQTTGESRFTFKNGALTQGPAPEENF